MMYAYWCRCLPHRLRHWCSGTRYRCIGATGVQVLRVLAQMSLHPYKLPYKCFVLITSTGTRVLICICRIDTIMRTIVTPFAAVAMVCIVHKTFVRMIVRMKAQLYGYPGFYQNHYRYAYNRCNHERMPYNSASPEHLTGAKGATISQFRSFGEAQL